VALDGAGNIVIGDTMNNRIRVVAESTGTFYGRAITAGDIYTVAGIGSTGFSGDGGPATAAELNLPFGVAVDGAGNVVIADTGNNRVRVVAESTGTFYGQAMTAGDIYSVAGTGTSKFSGDGGPAVAAALSNPAGVALDGSGNLVIADQDNGRARVIAATTGTFYRKAMTAGDIYTVAGHGFGSSGDGRPAATIQLGGPNSIRTDGAGDMVIADGTERVWLVAGRTGTFYGRAMTAGDAYAVAGNGRTGFSGDGGPAPKATLKDPTSAIWDGAGNLLITDSANNRIRVVAARTGTFYGQAMTAGDIYTIAGTGGKGFSGDGGPATSARLHSPNGLSLDGAGNLVFADTTNNRIRVIAGSAGSFYGQAMTAGDVYTVAGDGVSRFSGDGGPALSAGMQPYDVVVDAAGNLVFADTTHNRVRVIAGSTGSFYGQAMTAGDVYTVAGSGARGFSGDGGPAASAMLSFPNGVSLDGAGNLAIADTDNNRVRIVAENTGTFYGEAMTAGDIYTVAGTGTQAFSGDGGPGTSAAVDQPFDVTVDGAGNLLFADTGNGRIRMVTG
jgi:hypothetical protein